MTLHRTTVPLWIALLLVMGAGPIFGASFPPMNWWPCAFVGIAMVLVALRGRRIGTAFLVGFIAGESFYLILVSWTGRYLGPVPWVALSTLEALLWGGGAVLITLAYRYVPRAWPSVKGRIGLLPVLIASLWTLREFVTGSWPYGGFAWGRIAQSQSESPYSHLAAWVGVSGLSFVVVWIVACIVELLFSTQLSRTIRIGIAIIAITLTMTFPTWPTPTHGTLRIAAVQGNGPAGYFDDAPEGAVLETQVVETLKVPTTPRVQLVVWPEGSALPDPLTNSDTAAILDQLSTRFRAAILVGTITTLEGKYFNSSLQWEAGRGAVNQYDKKRPVPFGEYVPDRAFWRLFAPSLIDLIGRDYTPGTRANVFTIDGVHAGISICFDIVDDSLVQQMMQGGAQVIVAQTNNADFGETDENVQQEAIARLRAIETARSLVNVSTVGVTAVIGPSGKTLMSIPAFRPGHLVADVPLGTTTTPSTLFGGGYEWLFSGVGLAGLIIAWGARRSPDPEFGGSGPRWEAN